VSQYRQYKVSSGSNEQLLRIHTMYVVLLATWQRRFSANRQQTTKPEA
jgi:hypothetical protein